MRTCICDACRMEFKIEHLNKETDTMKNGQTVEVLSFTCPKCDERFIIAVRDEHSAELQQEYARAKVLYQASYDSQDEDKMRKARRNADYRKQQLNNYMHSLKKKYLKELRKRGK